MRNMATMVHPGLVAHTGLLQDPAAPFKWVNDTFGSTPEKGADTVLWAGKAVRGRNCQREAAHQALEIRTPGSGFGPRRAIDYEGA